MRSVSCQPAVSRDSEIFHDGVAPARSSVPLHFNANQLERFPARENHSSKQRSRNLHCAIGFSDSHDLHTTSTTALQFSGVDCCQRLWSSLLLSEPLFHRK
jgi:hypothetical protein